jgi:hypothetical protein
MYTLYFCYSTSSKAFLVNVVTEKTRKNRIHGVLL